MADKSGIQWLRTYKADGTFTEGSSWNPVRGCSRVSSGCDNCYAMYFASRFSGEGQPWEGMTRDRDNGRKDWTGVVTPVRERLYDPLRWTSPRKIFVTSMSDLFHPALDFKYIAEVFAVMALRPDHTFINFTKRPDVMARFFKIPDLYRNIREKAEEIGNREPRFQKLIDRQINRSTLPWPLPNLWLGISAEDDDTLVRRAPDLLLCPAAVHALSWEPALAGLTSLSKYTPGSNRNRGLTWIVGGGESDVRGGELARAYNPEWVQGVINLCASQQIPFFWKQNGNWPTGVVTELDPFTGTLAVALPDQGVVYPRRSDLKHWGARLVRGSVVSVRMGRKGDGGRLFRGKEYSQFPRPDYEGQGGVSLRYTMQAGQGTISQGTISQGKKREGIVSTTDGRRVGLGEPPPPPAGIADISSVLPEPRGVWVRGWKSVSEGERVEMLKCPSCQGRGTGGAFVDYDGRKKTFPCQECRGTGLSRRAGPSLETNESPPQTLRRVADVAPVQSAISERLIVLMEEEE